MNNRPGILLLVLAAGLGTSAAAAETPDRVVEGRAIAAEFGATLRDALQAAMVEGGPVAAIRVCNEEAAGIGLAAAAGTGATVGRTSMKVRNPANRPDDHERAVLAEFATALQADAGEAPPERLETLPDGRVRYMRAIVLQPQCLACHGSSLAPPVAERIETLYPEDAARGYEVGDLRGAFTITWAAD